MYRRIYDPALGSGIIANTPASLGRLQTICLLDLKRANTDLSNKLRESQNELVTLRGDYAALLAASSHLEAKNATLRDQLRAAHDEIRRRDGGMNGDSAPEVRMQDERFQVGGMTFSLSACQAAHLMRPFLPSSGPPDHAR